MGRRRKVGRPKKYHSDSEVARARHNRAISRNKKGRFGKWV